jgi:hypothetical protein
MNSAVSAAQDAVKHDSDAIESYMQGVTENFKIMSQYLTNGGGGGGGGGSVTHHYAGRANVDYGDPEQERYLAAAKAKERDKEELARLQEQISAAMVMPPRPAPTHVSFVPVTARSRTRTLREAWERSGQLSFLHAIEDFEGAMYQRDEFEPEKTSVTVPVSADQEWRRAVAWVKEHGPREPEPAEKKAVAPAWLAMDIWNGMIKGLQTLPRSVRMMAWTACMALFGITLAFGEFALAFPLLALGIALGASA